MTRSGSNYVIYSKGDGSWANDSIKPVLKSYHEAPSKVQRQLGRMKHNGQDDITIGLWFQPLTGGEWEFHVIDSSEGRLPLQQRRNLRHLLEDIRETGFNQLHIRFMQQEAADPINWTEWNELQYRQNLAFIKSVRLITETNKGNLKVIYDLGAELAGLGIYQHIPFGTQYCQRLWQDYVTTYGAGDSCAFSLSTAGNAAVAVQRLNKLLETLPRPFVYFIDCYSNHFLVFKAVHDALSAKNEGRKPIYLQECYYNDPATGTVMAQVKGIAGFNFAGIFQWPCENGQPGPASVNFTPDFNHYVAL
jgi:hypothetical protein